MNVNFLDKKKTIVELYMEFFIGEISSINRVNNNNFFFYVR